MSNLIGGIYRCVDVLNPTSDTLIGYVVNRNDNIDAILIAAGIDPNTVNHATTPLIGASRYGTVRVLVAADSLNGKLTPSPLPGAAYANGTDSSVRFAFRLWEPGGFSSGGKPGTGDGGTGPTNPDIGGGEGPPDIVIPDEPPADTNDGPDTQAGGGESDGPYGPGDRPNSLLGGVATQQGSSAFALMNMGRSMQWRGLIQTSSKEIIQSIGGNGVVNLYANTAACPGLWLMEFADPRLSLQYQAIAFQSSDPGSSSTAGYPRDQWNMLASNPLHLVAATCKASTTITPTTISPCLLPSGGISAGSVIGIPTPNQWYVDTAWSAAEIIGMYVGTTKSRSPTASWDRWPITYDYQRVADAEEVNGDMLNLDLRGRNIGEALDEIAARLGCVWIWDRFEMQLSLVSLKYGNGILGTDPGPTDRTSLVSWHDANYAFRSHGGFNTITNEMPDLCIGTVHQARHVSCWGNNPSQMFVDYRGCQSSDGVRIPNDTSAFQSTALATSARPPLYYMLNTACNSGRVGFIGDHVPAFCGMQAADPTQDPRWLQNISDPQGLQSPDPWNRQYPSSLSAWWQKSWAVTLEQRLSIAVDRYMMAQLIVDGSITLSRLPASFSNNYPMNRTPSSGFQWDEISFGRSDNTVQYRMWGSNSDEVLFPHLIPADRVKAFGLGSQYRAHGFVNLVHVPRSGGIVRSFLAEVARERDLLKVGTANDPAIWLYRFNEVYPSNVLDGVFSPSDEYGNAKLGARGYCLNLAEFNLPISGQAPDGPKIAVDGGELTYDAKTDETKIIRTPVGGIVICYEYLHPSGITMHFLSVTNGVKVTCPTSTAPMPLNPAWEKSGASGVGDTAFESLASIIQA